MKKPNLSHYKNFKQEYPLTSWDVAYKKEDGTLCNKDRECFPKTYIRSQFTPYLNIWRKLKWRDNCCGEIAKLDQNEDIHWQIAWVQKPYIEKYKGDWRNGCQEEEYKTYPVWNYGTDAVVINIRHAIKKNRAFITFDSWDDDIAFCAEYIGEDVKEKVNALKNFISLNKESIDFENLTLDKATKDGWEQY